jgi:hypothetical protein
MSFIELLVCAFGCSAGASVLGPTFRRHCITGKQLLALDDAGLRSLQVCRPF